MKITVKNASITEVKTDLLIVNLFEGVQIPGGATGAIDKELKGLISDYVIQREKFDGKFGKFYFLPTPNHPQIQKVMIAGLGKRSEFSVNKIRELSSNIIQNIKTMENVKTITTIVHGAGSAGFDACDCAKAITEGFYIGYYDYDKYKTINKNLENIIIVESNKEQYDKAQEGVKTGKITGEAINYTRELVNEPAQEMTPQKLADIAESLPLNEVKIYEGKDIQNMHMGAFYAVGQGSTNPPKFIHMEYMPKNPKKKIVLIGKGITFDSGGLNLKPPLSMITMKDDMSGAAAVLAVMRALKSLNPKVEVHGLIAACENMPSGSSYKQGDVLTASNGKTIEVDNTDAEGRLTLADALCYAQDLNPDIVIDIATLTGACMVALGSVASGIMGNNDEAVKQIIQCGKNTGEIFVELPLLPEYGDSIKSDIADMKNSGARNGGAMIAGLFLKNFIDDKIPWVHLDIAGTAMIDKAVRECPKGPTGVGVRTMIEYITKCC